MWVYSRPQPAPPVRNDDSFQRVTSADVHPTAPALSRDGSMVAFVSDNDVWVQRIGDGSPAMRLTSGSRTGDPEFSADGASLYYTSYEKPEGVYRASPAGGPTELILPNAYSAKISPDGGSLAFGAHGSVYIRPVDGGTSRQLVPGFDNVTQPVWSPDGGSVVVTGRERSTDEPDCWIVPVAGGPGRNTGILAALKRAGMRAVSIHQWLESNQLLFSALQGDDESVWKIAVPQEAAPIGNPEKVTNLAEPVYGASAYTGKLAVSRRISAMNFWELPVSPEGDRVIGPLARITSGEGQRGQESISRDGKRLLYSSQDSGPVFSLFLKELPDGPPKKLVFGGFFGTLSPDGSHYAYGEGTKDRLDVRMKGTRWWSVLSSSLCEACGMPRSISADGKRVLLQTDSDPKRHLDVLDTGSGKIQEIVWSAFEQFYAPQLSPDGQWIVFVAGAEQRWQTFIAPVRAGGAEKPDWIPVAPQTESFHLSFWSAAGDMVYVLTSRPGHPNLLWLEAQRLNPASRQPVGARIAMYELSEAQAPSMDPLWNTMSAIPGKIVLELNETAAGIWIKPL